MIKSICKTSISFIICFAITSCSQKDDLISIYSPDGFHQIIIEYSDSVCLTQVYKGDTIMSKSKLGFFINGKDIFQEITSLTSMLDYHEETWEPVIGKVKSVKNNYSEVTLNLNSTINKPLEFTFKLRCYNDGFAYRYLIPEQLQQDSVTINGESTTIKFNNDFDLWAYNGERHNIGPVTWSQSKDTTYRIPVVSQHKENVYMGIHEAEIIRYAPFQVKKNKADNLVQFHLKETIDALPIKTSWRTFLIGEKPGDLVNSNLLCNLNQPCKIEDPSWIKPGRAVWDWRVWGCKTAEGFEYGLNTDSHLRFIDFAANNNIQYLLIDADWYGPEFDKNSDPMSAKKDVDIEKCMAYAQEKGVGIILYLNDVGAKKYGLERILKQFSDWGASGIKYGFMRGSVEQKVRYTRKVVELCAKYRLTVNFHDNPIPPSGDDRTWPNLITKEFCHSQADAKRSYFPETIVTTTFVNMMAGAIDNCDGWFDFNTSLNRVRVFEEIPGTVAAEVAKLIAVYTGMNVMPDAPEEYLKKDDLFECIRKMPSQFDSFKVIDGKIGEYIIVARQAGKNWFVGVLTNRASREVNLDMSFLTKGETYDITIYEDAETTHFLNERESYQIRKTKGRKESNLKLSLAPGGGTALFIQPATGN